MNNDYINDKLKDNKLSTIKKIRTFAALTGLATVIGFTGCGKHISNREANEIISEIEEDSFNDMDLDDLLMVINNSVQKEAMERRVNVITYLNGDFADYYLESDKDIRFGLHYSELEALDLAYNNYTKEEILAIYNGSSIDPRELDNAYKTGTLMMMGAYTLSDSNMPVKGYNLIRSESLRVECKRWEDRFYAIKNATGEDKIELLSEFYEDINSLFPISEDVRTEGIAHYDTRASLDYELLAYLTPMIAACEQMYQNLDVDVTLNDQAIDYINDLGACNYLEDKFENYADYANCCNYEIDPTYPTGEYFAKAISNYLAELNILVIDDEHRDISRYDRFQEIVNWHFEMDMYGYYTGKTIISTETYQVKESWSETTTDTKTRTESKVREEGRNVSRDDAVKAVGEDKVREVDEEIERENREAKEQAEREAEERRRRLQEEENRKREELERQAEEENRRNEQEIIDNAPDYVDPGTISSDPGSTSDLPDPNVSGREFDNNEPDYCGPDPVTDDQIMNVSAVPQSINTSSAKATLIAEAIVEEMANIDATTNEVGYQYTK